MPSSAAPITRRPDGTAPLMAVTAAPMADGGDGDDGGGHAGLARLQAVRQAQMASPSPSITTPR